MTHTDNDSQDGLAVLESIVKDIFHLSEVFHRNDARWAGSVGLTYRQWMLLESAADDLRTVPQLARRMGLARQTIQRTADQLVDRKMASFQRNPDHLRSPYLMINDRGLGLLLAIERNVSQQRREFVGGERLDKSDLEAAEKVLRRFREFVDLTAGRETDKSLQARPEPARRKRSPED